MSAVTVTLKDRYGRVVVNKKLTDITSAKSKIDAIAKEYPDFWVFVKWPSSNKASKNPINIKWPSTSESYDPINLQKDLIKLEEDEMTMEELTSKWYPASAKAKEALDKELEKAMKDAKLEEDLEDGEPFMWEDDEEEGWLRSCRETK